MDNRFLFRGKRVDDGEWVYGAFCPKDSYEKGLLFPDKHAHACIIPLAGADEGYWIRVHPETVGQCTGLSAAKSYRGSKPEDLLVWEGDILKISNNNQVDRVNQKLKPGRSFCSAVSYQGARFIIEAEPMIFYGKYDCSVDLALNQCDRNGFDVEIIGTIHDNPASEE